MLIAAEKDATKKASLIAEDAKQKLERDVNSARDKLKNELVGLVSDATKP